MVDKRSDRRIILYCLASLRSECGRLCLEWLATFSWTSSRHPWKMHIFISKVGYALKAGHPLEDSCQEGKRPPYTPFCIFCRGMSLGISLPICRLARTRVFSGCDVDRLGATHQTPIRIKALYGCLTMWPGIRPLARHVPQKTLGTLPCPIVTSTVHMALLYGATPTLARGRGVANTQQVVWRPSGMD